MAILTGILKSGLGSSELPEVAVDLESHSADAVWMKSREGVFLKDKQD